MPKQEQSNGGKAGTFALVCTNTVKLAGTVLAFIEATGRQEVRPLVIGVCGLMILGVQGVENFVKGMMGK